MGKRKRILLLALLIIISGKTYSEVDIIVSNEQNVTDKNKTGNWAAGKTVTVTESGKINVSGEGASGITVKVEENKKGEAINNGEINASGVNSKGVNFSSGGGKGENNNKITATGAATGVYFGATGEFINNSKGVFEIKGNNSKGIYLNSEGTAKNAGTITVGGTGTGEAGAIGVQVNKANAEFTNESGGIISSIGANSKGIQVNIGTAENSGKIQATEGASGVYVNGASGSFINKETIVVSGANSKGISFGEKGGEAENSGVISVVDKGIGVYFGSSVKFVKAGNFINKDKIQVVGTDSKGIYLNLEGIAKNAGTITVGGTNKGEAGAIGVQVNNANAKFTNESGGTISSIGVNSKGIQVNIGTAENSGSIQATEGASGVYVNEANGVTGSFLNKETIFTSGENSKGIHFGSNGGTAENSGTISVTEKGIGTYFGGNGTFTNKESGKIQVTETNSIGIYLNSEGTATNAGTIIVGGIGAGEAGAIGVQVNNTKSKFTNESKGIISSIGTNSKGIQVNNGTAENSGKIQATEGASGVYVNGASGSFTNNSGGKIVASGASSKGIFFGENVGTVENNGTIEVDNGASGIFFYQGTNNNFTNNSAGIINVYRGKSVGLLLNAQGTAENEGTITVAGEDGIGVQLNNANAKFTNVSGGTIEVSGANSKGIQINSGTAENKGTITVNGGKGVVLGGGTFTNTGTIDAGKDGIAIESLANTNNTLILKEEKITRNLTSAPSITGKIVGNTGIDVLVLDNASYSGLNISGYENISVIGGNNSSITNSVISLGYNADTADYLSNSGIASTSSGDLSIDNSSVVIDLANQTSGVPLISAGSLALGGEIKLAFSSTNGQKEFDLNKILGGESTLSLNVANANFGDTAVWNYTVGSDGKLKVVKNDYSTVMTKSQLRNFADVLDNGQYTASGDFQQGVALLSTLNAGEFTGALTQLSGGVHGYMPDLTVINSRTLTGAMKNRTLSRDTTRNRPVSSYDQDIVYINNHHKLGGLMDVKYDENGILGITEKQILSNGRMGLVYGGSKGKVKFDGGTNGKADMDNLYIGGYYNHEFSDKLMLMSSMNFVYSHNNVTRYLKFGDLDYTFDSTYPSFGFGAGTTLFYTVYDKDGNKAVLYGGINWEKVIQGNINEEPDRKDDKNNENLTVKNVPANEQWYDSVVPNIGISLQHNGYILDRKYRLGADIGYETELGNIKDGKRLKLSALDKVHSVETTTRENILSYSLYGELDMTENLSIFADYTKSKSKEYDADKIGAGFKYKMDRMSDVFVMGPILSGIENTRLHSNRWNGVMSLMMEAEDDTNRPYYDEAGKLSSGDYATSLKLKPKFTLSLNDRETKWSYYFEGYYLGNSLGTDRRVNERKQYDTRLHGEARWTDQYTKGRYGFTVGYRNETSSKPNLSQYAIATRSERGTHEFRFAPNFTYNLGNGFVFGGSTTGIVTYDYRGARKGEMDFEMENQYGITYTGFMPRMRLTVNYFREEFWRDHGYRKPARTKLDNGQYVFDLVEGDRRYQSNQLRPSLTYFFGNGGRLQLDARIPLGNGAWYNADGDGKKAAETYETRYGIKYFQPITPGLTGFIGTEILTMKAKNKNHASPEYGKETRTYSIRPSVGFAYNF